MHAEAGEKGREGRNSNGVTMCWRGLEPIKEPSKTFVENKNNRERRGFPLLGEGHVVVESCFNYVVG